MIKNLAFQIFCGEWTLAFSSTNCNYSVPYNALHDFLLLPTGSLLWLPPALIIALLWELPVRIWTVDSTIRWDDMVHMNRVSPNGEGAPLWLNFVTSHSVSLCALHVLWSTNICEWMLRKGIMVQLVGHFWLEGWPNCGDSHVAILIKDDGPRLTVNATRDLFLDCNLTQFFNFSNIG